MSKVGSFSNGGFTLNVYAVIVESLGSDRQADKFLLWALGIGKNKKIPVSMTPDLWNKKHPHAFKLKGSDSIRFTLNKMIRLYRKRFSCS